MAVSGKSPASVYSRADRLLHRLAFAHPVLQKALGELESDLMAPRFAQVEARRPVFVTGLPRAGSTLLLETLHATGEFSTFTYREMPFVLAPILWSDLTKGSRKTGAKRERAHGDGVEISFDSPEAFEEIAWLAYMRDKIVGAASLSPVGAADLSTEFREAFVNLVRKLIAAQSDRGEPKRYLSKNNANISRVDALKVMFPDATVLICLREPASHVRSLMTQHRRFLAMHEEDRFAADYMRWIGHFDFGENFRPIDFFARGLSPAGADSVDFWLRYWIDAYRYADARRTDGVAFFDYERLLFDPSGALSGLARRVGIANEPALFAAAARLRAPTTRPGGLEGADEALIAEAVDLYRKLSG